MEKLIKYLCEPVNPMDSWDRNERKHMNDDIYPESSGSPSSSEKIDGAKAKDRGLNELQTPPPIAYSTWQLQILNPSLICRVESNSSNEFELRVSSDSACFDRIFYQHSEHRSKIVSIKYHNANTIW
jgi:hypothetical protein